MGWSARAAGARRRQKGARDDDHGDARDNAPAHEAPFRRLIQNWTARSASRHNHTHDRSLDWRPASTTPILS